MTLLGGCRYAQRIMMKKIFGIFALSALGFNAMAFDIVAHRGEKTLAPENSVEAAKLAWGNGVRFVEGDFYMLADGKIICLHGENELKKFSGLEKKIEELTDDDIKGANLADNDEWRAKYSFVAVPTLQDIMKTVPKDGVLVLEIKGWKAGFGKKLEEARKACGLEKKNILLIAFSGGAIKKTLAECGGGYDAMLLFGAKKNEDGSYIHTPEKIIAKCKEIGANGVDIGSTEFITAEYVKAFKDAGLKVYTWTVNDFEELKRLESIGVEGVTTDMAGEFLKKYREWKVEK